LLNISRGSVYYLPRATSSGDLALMRRIDELHLDYPFAGARMLRDLLAGEGIRVGRLHVSTLMKRMGIEAIYRKPNTSKPAPGHKVYPYLLRRLAVTRPNQVWVEQLAGRRWRPEPAVEWVAQRSTVSFFRPGYRLMIWVLQGVVSSNPLGCDRFRRVMAFAPRASGP
jgi:hypothetical protein